MKSELSVKSWLDPQFLNYIKLSTYSPAYFYRVDFFTFPVAAFNLNGGTPVFLFTFCYIKK